MPYHCLVPLAAALANLVIGALVLRQGAREPLHRVFAALTLAVVCWNLDLFALYYFHAAAAAEWWISSQHLVLRRRGHRSTQCYHVRSSLAALLRRQTLRFLRFFVRLAHSRSTATIENPIRSTPPPP